MGTFYVYDEKSGKLLGTAKNHFVNSGKQATIDWMFNSTDWGVNTTRYIEVGKSTTTNNIPGPTVGSPVAANGDWQGVSSADWKITETCNGATRIQCSCIRTGNTAFIQAVITDAHIPGNESITEIGIFLGEDTSKPTADPTDTVATVDNRNHAMICKSIFYMQQGANYIVTPIAKTIGSNLVIRYVFSDFEG